MSLIVDEKLIEVTIPSLLGLGGSIVYGIQRLKRRFGDKTNAGVDRRIPPTVEEIVKAFKDAQPKNGSSPLSMDAHATMCALKTTEIGGMMDEKLKPVFEEIRQINTNLLNIAGRGK